MGDPAVAIYNGAREAEAVVARAQSIKRGGAPGIPWRDALFAGPPPFEAKNRWSQKRTLEWASDTFDWLRDQLARATPGHRPAIHSAVMHLDERSAHLHTIFAPIIYDGQGPKLSWKRFAVGHGRRGEHLWSAPNAGSPGFPVRVRVEIVRIGARRARVAPPACGSGPHDGTA